MDDKSHQEKQSEFSEQAFAAIKKKMQELQAKTDGLFAELGISPHQLHHYLNDPERYCQESRRRIEDQQEELDAILERRIQEAKQKIEKTASPFDTKPGGHWIFMR